MERKWIIAIVIIAIVLVGGLGWYYFFGMPREEAQQRPVVYIDAMNYTTPFTWEFINPVPNTVWYALHNITSTGADTGDVAVRLNCTVLYTNTTHTTQIFNGRTWARNANVSLGTFLSMGTLNPWQPFANKTNEKTTYWVFFSYTDQAITIKFQYPGDHPTVDGQTVFNYLAFDGNNNNKTDALDKAFNFTNNPNRVPNQNSLQVYTPETDCSWQLTSTHGWNTTSPSTAPVTVAITSDRKNITWTIPFGAIGAEKDQKIGLAFQAFSHDWFPSGINATSLSKYQKVQLALSSTSAPYTLTVPPQTTINFYIKVSFLQYAKSGNYSFTFQPFIP